MNERTPIPVTFDEEIDRHEVPALKVHPNVIGKDAENLFAAGVADMDFKAPKCIRDALQKRLDHGVFGYEAMPDELLQALINWQETHHDWQIEQSHILRSPNILNTLAIASSLFSEPGDNIIVQPPVFFDFFDIIQENNRTILTNPLVLRDGRYFIDFDDLEEKATLPRTKMIYLCNPHNPMGRIWSAQELRRLGDICERNGVLVISDEIHGDLALGDIHYTPFASLGDKYAANAISCISPAKTFNIASCCSAFTIIKDEQRRKAFQTENSRLTVNKNNAFANVAMQAAYQNGEPWLRHVLVYLQTNVEYLRARLVDIPGVELIEPEATFLTWLDMRGLGIEPEKLNDFLKMEAKWAVTRGLAFGEQGAGFARLNIACTRARLAAALDKLATAVAK